MSSWFTHHDNYIIHWLLSLYNHCHIRILTCHYYTFHCNFTFHVMFKKLSLRFPFYFHIKRSVFGFFETGGYNLLFMFSIPNFIQSLLFKSRPEEIFIFLSTGITTVLTMTFLGLEARKDLPKVRNLKCTEENNYYYDYIILYICIQTFCLPASLHFQKYWRQLW